MYLIIFKTAKESVRKTGRKQHEIEEIRMAIRMSAVVLKDFCTWVLLILVCILVQADVIMVDPVVYAWTVAFIFPINSAINPFLYTLISLLYKRKKETRPKKFRLTRKKKLYFKNGKHNNNSVCLAIMRWSVSFNLIRHLRKMSVK